MSTQLDRMRAAVVDCRDYLKGIADSLPRCDRDQFCGPFCEQNGCARMRVEHCERALKGSRKVRKPPDLTDL